MKYSKIVATIGPKSRSAEMIQALIAAGVDVFRLNMSHGTQADHAETFATIRRLSREHGRPVGILIDLQGPKIRVGEFANSAPVLLEPGHPFILSVVPVMGSATRASTSFEALTASVKPHDSILLNDGLIELIVEAIEGPEVITTVRRGGWLSAHKGINLPHAPDDLPALTEKDLRDLDFAVKLGADFIALSFVRRARDIARLREHLAELGALDIPVIAKIEKPQALTHLDEILELSDGVMVARGDLGVELSYAEVPGAQKTIIQKARQKGVFVITATQMLESMIEHPVPTRAEVSDIANAIIDGTDALMLSGETAVGQYPLEAVQMMRTIAETTEASPFFLPLPLCDCQDDPSPAASIARAVADICEDPDYRGIAVLTISGRSAAQIARYRKRKPIYALTPNPQTFQQLAIRWGVTPIRAEFGENTDEAIANAEKMLTDAGLLLLGDMIILVAGATPHRGATNMMKIYQPGLK
jgi:pyruvate kinase